MKRICTINFKFNQSTPDASTLNSIIELIKQGNKENVKILLEGHTDNVGTEEYNQKLSEKRAKAVKSELVKQKVISSNSIEIKGLGESQPKIDCKNNCSTEEHSKNRRVEIKFIPSK